MKIKITLLLLAAASALNMSSQVVLTENFSNTGSAATAGWTIQNNSVPSGGLADWFQGNPGAFTAFNGAPDEYLAANYQSVPTGAGDISTWLFSPTVTITNGAVFQFATRGTNITPAKADRLQLRLCTDAASNFAVPNTGTASVGSYTTVLLDINPNLTTNTVATVNNGTVNGYPQVWTIYTVQISGITGSVPGKFAFRYFVGNGGSTGPNSLYIGVDAVKYTLPCGPTVQSFTTCAGVSTTLTAIGGLPATTYTWSGGSAVGVNSPSTVVSPTATTVYTLTPYNGNVACPALNTTTASVTVGTVLSMNIGVSSSTVCVGKTLTLTAIGSATAYNWSNGATTQTTVVIPNFATTYSVTGAAGSCLGSASIAVNPTSNPTINAVFSPTAICPSTTFVATGSGAVTYNWQLSSTNSIAGTSVSLIAPANPGSPQFTLSGTDANGCTSNKVIVLTVNPQPVVSGIIARDIVCTKDTVSMIADGADTYTWSINGVPKYANPFTYTTTTTANAALHILLSGTTLGCKSATVTINLNVNACTGIENFAGSGVANIYPNPFINELTLEGLAGNVEIYNALGQVVIKEPVAGTERINTATLPKGVYILKAYNEQGKFIKAVKLLKN